MCCQARWKREVVPDHKFDFINIHEYHIKGFFTRFRYLIVYLMLLKSFAVYCLDSYTAITMLSTNHWTNAIYSKCGDDCFVTIDFRIAKWIFVGCIIASFVLLAYESNKARLIVRSRDISYAYTNVMAHDYLSVRDYDYFCFWCHVSESEKKKDGITGFVFFTFKGWKRLILTDGPRQSINALTLYSFAYANDFQTSDLTAYWDNSISTLLLLLAMIATVLIWMIEMAMLIAAAICYIPLLCYIQGNLKEYFCHKVDKRIAELIRRKQRQRLKRNMLLEKQLEGGALVRDKNGQVIKGTPQPTIPVVAFDEDEDDMKMRGQKSIARPRPGYKHMPSDSQLRQSSHSAQSNRLELGYPGLPPQASIYSSDNAPNGQHQSAAYNLPQEHMMYAGDQYGSSVNLVESAAPPGLANYPMQRMESQDDHRFPIQDNGYYANEPGAYAYGYMLDYDQAPSHPYPPVQRHSGLAYDEVPSSHQYTEHSANRDRNFGGAPPLY